MPYDGFGNFTRSYNWTADKVALIKIQAARMDGEFDNYATALNQVLLRSGVAAMTGDFKAGGNKFTGIGLGTAGAPSLSVNGDTTTGLFFPTTATVALAGGGVERFRTTPTGAAVPSGQLFGVGTSTPRTQLDVVGFSSVRGIFEDTTLSASALTGTVNLDAVTAGVIIYSANAAGNWTFNVRGDAANTLNSIMGIGQSLTFAIEVPQGAAPYYCTTVTVDGAAPSQLYWFDGAPTAGNASGIDVYTITVIKTAAATFKVRASQAQVR